MGELENLRAANIAYSQQVNELIGRAGNAEAERARMVELIDMAFDAAASDLEANKGEHEFEHINGAYYGLCLMRMEINKALKKAATP